jgi:hypothetical protein
VQAQRRSRVTSGTGSRIIANFAADERGQSEERHFISGQDKEIVNVQVGQGTGWTTQLRKSQIASVKMPEIPRR